MTDDERTEWRHVYDERAAIMQHVGGLSRQDAERRAGWAVRAQMSREGYAPREIEEALRAD